MVATTVAAQQPASGSSRAQLTDRQTWLDLLLRVARPVLEAAAEGKLQQLMPVEAAAGHETDRRPVTHLEAVGRTLAGIAPWLENGVPTGEEGRALSRFRSLALETIVRGVAKGTPAWLNF